MGGAAANFDVVILFKGDGNRRFQRRAYRLDRHTRLPRMGRRLFRQIRNMDKTGLLPAFSLQRCSKPYIT